jgi:hypothetical protein
MLAESGLPVNAREEMAAEACGDDKLFQRASYSIIHFLK